MEVPEQRFIFMVVCPSHSVSQRSALRYSSRAVSVTSSHTVTVLLHLDPDLVSHHRGVVFQLVQLRALPLHPLLVTLELFLQFCRDRQVENHQRLITASMQVCAASL